MDRSIAGNQFCKMAVEHSPYQVPFESITNVCVVEKLTLLVISGKSSHFDQRSAIFSWGFSSKRFEKFLDFHEDTVTSLKCSKDNTLLLSCSKDFTVKIWDLASRSLLNTIKIRRHIVRDIAITSDNNFIISVGDDRNVAITDVNTLKSLILQGHSLAVVCVVITPDDKYFFTGSDDKSIRLWNFQKCLKVIFSSTDWILGLCITPDAKSLFAIGNQKKVIKFNLENNEPQAASICIQWGFTKVATNGKFVITGCKDNCTRVWNLDLSLAFVIKGFVNLVSDVVVDSTSNLVYSASLDGSLNVFDLNLMETAEVLTGHYSDITCMIGNDKGIRITGGEDRTLRVWDQSKHLETLRSHSGPVTCMAVYQSTMASADKNSVIVWDFYSKTRIYKIIIANTTDLAIHPNGYFYAAAKKRNHYWNSKNREVISQPHKFLLLLEFKKKFRIK